MTSTLPVRREDKHLLDGWPACSRTGAVMVRYQIPSRRTRGGFYPGVVSLVRVVEIALFPVLVREHAGD